MSGAVVTGWGIALPEKVVTNADLESNLDTSDEWIVERTGIRERRVGGTVTGLATSAGAAALEVAHADPATVDLLVLATTTPDQAIPASSATVHRELGLGGGAMDLNAACAGFVYALSAAHAYLVSGMGRILVIGADTLSTVTDWGDRSTAVLFGDGAAGLVLERSERDAFLGWNLGVDGSAASLLYCDHGGTMKMVGQEVFRRAVRATVESAEAAMEEARVAAADISLFVPHQANMRIIDAAFRRLKIPEDRVASVLQRTGNTSAASIPLALVDAVTSGRLVPGDLVLMAGFGAGMTWASTVMRWGTQ